MTGPTIADPMADIFPLGGPPARGRRSSEVVDSIFGERSSFADAFGAGAAQAFLDSPGSGSVAKAITRPDGAPSQIEWDAQPAPLGNPDDIEGMPRLPPLARRTYPTAMTKDAWETSENFRADVPYDPAMSPERAAYYAAWSDARALRERAMAGRPVASFLGGLGGGFGDFVNFIPVVGPGVRASIAARTGLASGRILSASLDAALNTAIAGAATASYREQWGDDVSLEGQLAQAGMAAVVGGVFGAGGHVVDRLRSRRVADALDQMATLERLNASREVTADALQSHALTGQLDLTPESVEILNAQRREAAAIGEAYDRVLADPDGGVNDPLIAILPDHDEGTTLARGAFKDVNPQERSRRGWGLVKIIWRHGERGTDPAHLQATRDDVTALPEVVREFETSDASADGRLREWRIERDGATVVYADTMFGEGDRRVVTVYRQAPGGPGSDKPFSRRREVPLTEGSRADALNAEPDTGRPPFSSSDSGLQERAAPESGASNVREQAWLEQENMRVRDAYSRDLAQKEADLQRFRAGEYDQMTVDPFVGERIRDGESRAAYLDRIGRNMAGNVDRAQARLNEPPKTLADPYMLDFARAAVGRMEGGRPQERAVPDARTDISSTGRPDDAAALARQFGVDAKTGAFREEADLAQVVAEGRVTASDAAELKAAQDAADDGTAFADALQVAARCLI